MMTVRRETRRGRSSRIVLKGLRVKGFHGVFDHERRDGQDFVVDAVLHLEPGVLEGAAESDDLARTIDYGVLAQSLAAVVRGEPRQLIEALADDLIAICLEDERVSAAEVTLHKPGAPIPEDFTDVAIELYRRREPAPGPMPAVIALGANLGDREQALRGAVRALTGLDGVELTGVSPVVQTAPVGGPEQDDYLNAVVTARTALRPEQLLAACHGIEAALGRRRQVRWGPRTLDLDLIVVGRSRRAVPGGLQLPHPRAAERAFVLLPWSLLDPEAELPGLGRVAELAAAAADRGGVRPYPQLDLSTELVTAR